MKHALVRQIIFAIFVFIGNTGLSQNNSRRANSDWAQSQPYVVMLSIDGFRHDYAEKYRAKNLLEIAKNGASTEAMIPSFPSKTFPNHYTLVTGLRPAEHGIVGNSFYSRSKGRTYSIGNRDEVTDGSWYQGTPLWVLAEQHQMLSASYYWVGSEANIQGYLPTYFETYDHKKPNDERIDKVLEWLELPDDTRPHIITLYFAIVDDAGHAFGPNSQETKQAVLEADRLIGRLRTELKALELPIYFIVTSDHGMTEINEGIDLSSIDFGNAVADFSSTMLMVYSDSSELISSISEQLNQFPNLEVLSKQEAGERHGFVNDDRVGDLVVLCEPPYVIQKSPQSVKGGTHGYDPLRYEDMGAIFYIEGPEVKAGTRIKAFDNVEVYPLVVELLGLGGENSSKNLSWKLLK